MGLPVKLSNTLVTAAREEAEAGSRSLTAQIEHWAILGRAVEKLLPHGQVAALKRLGGGAAATPALANREAVGRLLRRLVASDARAAEQAHLGALGGPRYGVDPKHPGLLLRIEADGTRTLGRLEGRTFVPAKPVRNHKSA
ncbi:hypothetical protein [Reyranella sp. CPCC 100927]|uniref:TA system antitoxin ParD family protein n=1 Tax=Reyranella sp. CPCC 100927 TaxID=2599616 RepID=UPI0011B5371B|nr:hypothetical protein [Reyranella sp. CPCC 100927]TWT09948.1 hypothetical protein FQU96_17795 [Reyranella sp. CPCC 100927]